MKIANTTPNYINQTYTNPNNPAAGQDLNSQKPSQEPVTDSINLSERTLALQKVSQAMENDPVDRQKYVADIKQRVENDQYNVNAEQVAQKMVGAFMDIFE